MFFPDNRLLNRTGCRITSEKKICCKSLQELLQMWVGGRTIKQDKTNKESSAKSLYATETCPKFNSEFMKYEATVWTPTVSNILPFISSLVLKKQIK